MQGRTMAMLGFWRALALAALPAALLPGPAAAADDGAAFVVDRAERAIGKGYGEMCSLEMEPVQHGGYYPCLDFGPYRIVFEYRKVSGFVVQEGHPPFKVMGGGEDDPSFARNGPWVADMPARMASWWNEIVEGGAARARARTLAEARRSVAETYIRSLGGSSPVPAASRGESPALPAETEAVPTGEVLADTDGEPAAASDLARLLGSGLAERSCGEGVACRERVGAETRGSMR